jgi:hypothetical protein
MAGPHDDLLTAVEHQAAQLISADQLLARLCAIPAHDIAMASIVLLRQVVHGVAPELRRPPTAILGDLGGWLEGDPASGHRGQTS